LEISPKDTTCTRHFWRRFLSETLKSILINSASES
jgi:hypothetical protein